MRGIDPYVLIKYKSNERESSVSRGMRRFQTSVERKVQFQVQYPNDSGGSDPYKLFFKVMDKDTFSDDDLIGQTDLLALGVEKGRAEIHPRKYSVVGSNQSYNGGIRVGLIFTPTKVRNIYFFISTYEITRKKKIFETMNNWTTLKEDHRSKKILSEVLLNHFLL
ncbi:hypothetical protein MKX01_027217 [Papaver californicum]|nr:hypothetical protein MKX01_027217 [Papaver californicum]